MAKLQQCIKLLGDLSDWRLAFYAKSPNAIDFDSLVFFNSSAASSVGVARPALRRGTARGQKTSR
jgi:hypothetical protein